ncbi:MAG: outer membrane protein assembly factor BamC [Pseudomonadota bacterium]
MQRSKLNRTFMAALACLLLVSACSLYDKMAPGARKVDYKKSKPTDTLEVPPDLSSHTINEAPASIDIAGTTYSEMGAELPAGGGSSVLPDQASMRVERDGDQQWLVVQGVPDQVWPQAKEFWLQEGFLINREDPRVGILETGWLENRADIPTGLIRNVLGKVIDSAYTAATRDQYRTRLERGAEPGFTEIYVTHRGVEEVVTGTAVDSTTTWTPRPSDPELEAEMLKRLMVFLGVEEQKAAVMVEKQPEQSVRAQLVSDSSGDMLIINEDFSRAWRRTGVALDRVGFAVEDRARSDGIYYVQYNDPLAEQNKEGFFTRIGLWSSDDEADGTQYQIVLQANGPSTSVIVNDSQGERDTTSTAKRILTLLEEQLR